METFFLKYVRESGKHRGQFTITDYLNQHLGEKKVSCLHRSAKSFAHSTKCNISFLKLVCC